MVLATSLRFCPIADPGIYFSSGGIGHKFAFLPLIADPAIYSSSGGIGHKSAFLPLITDPGIYSSSGGIGHKFAFLPLIADPDDSGKTQLFHTLSEQEANIG